MQAQNNPPQKGSPPQPGNNNNGAPNFPQMIQNFLQNFAQGQAQNNPPRNASPPQPSNNNNGAPNFPEMVQNFLQNFAQGQFPNAPSNSKENPNSQMPPNMNGQKYWKKFFKNMHKGWKNGGNFQNINSSIMKGKIVDEKRKKVTGKGGMITFAKWNLENASEESWPNPTYVQIQPKRSQGIEFEPLSLQPIPSNTKCEVSIPIKVPSKVGQYQAVFRLVDSFGKRFGQKLKVDITSESNEVNIETIIHTKANLLVSQGFGTYEACYNALISSNGNE